MNCTLVTVFLMFWNNLLCYKYVLSSQKSSYFFFWDYEIIFILTNSKVKWIAFKTDLLVEKITSHLLPVIGPLFTIDWKWSFLTFPHILWGIQNSILLSKLILYSESTVLLTQIILASAFSHLYFYYLKGLCGFLNIFWVTLKNDIGCAYLY